MRSASIQFKLWNRNEAARFLATVPQTGDTVGDRISAQRALAAVTETKERVDAKLFRVGKTYPCAKCKKHCFAKPRTVCYWCRQSKHSSASTAPQSSGSDSAPLSSSVTSGNDATLKPKAPRNRRREIKRDDRQLGFL